MRRTNSLRPWLIALAGGAAASWLACSGCQDEAAAPTPVPPAPIAHAEAQEALTLVEDPAIALQTPGTVVVSRSGGAITLAGRDVEREKVVRELGRALGFEVDWNAVPTRKLTLALRAASVDALLHRALAGVVYSADYRLDAAGEHQLASLSVGERPRASADGGDAATTALAAAATGRDAAAAGPGAAPARRRGSGSESERQGYEERRALVEEHESRAAATSPSEQEDLDEHRAIREQLASGDPQRQLAALADVDVDSDDAQWVMETAEFDPNPAVRLAAVNALAEGSSVIASMGLLNSLDDPSSAVVMRALEGLEFQADEAFLPYLLPLKNHPDAQVAAKAAEMIDDL